jgi:hypothetical protein
MNVYISLYLSLSLYIYKTTEKKRIGVLGLKSVVLEIAYSCRRINLFSNVKYGNFGVWKFPTDIFSAFFARFFDRF